MDIPHEFFNLKNVSVDNPICLGGFPAHCPPLGLSTFFAYSGDYENYRKASPRNDSLPAFGIRDRAAAALGGHLEFLKSFDVDQYSFSQCAKYAVIGGHVHILEWLYDPREKRFGGTDLNMQRFFATMHIESSFFSPSNLDFIRYLAKKFKTDPRSVISSAINRCEDVNDVKKIVDIFLTREKKMKLKGLFITDAFQRGLDHVKYVWHEFPSLKFPESYLGDTAILAKGEDKFELYVKHYEQQKEIVRWVLSQGVVCPLHDRAQVKEVFGDDIFE